MPHGSDCNLDPKSSLKGFLNLKRRSKEYQMCFETRLQQRNAFIELYIPGKLFTKTSKKYF
jgi:hypothetical protein